MLDSQTIHKEWTHFFDTVHTADGWITPLLDAVNGVTVETAAWKPDDSISSIWEIVAHATGWVDDLLADLTGSYSSEAVDWPPVGIPSQDAWETQVEILREKVATLERQLKGLTVEEIYQAPPRVSKRRSERMTNIFVHNAYHTGQIVKMRQLHAALAPAAVVA